MFTLVDRAMRDRLQTACVDARVPCVSILEPLIDALTGYLGLESKRQPGRQHVLDAVYFSRMDAVEFALAHDDGQSIWNLHQADVVLVGVSRTSKTPTCLYLANRGIRAANVPIVPGAALPDELERLKRPLVVGLTKDPDRLVQVRSTRVKMIWKSGDRSAYVDPAAVEEEVRAARRLFAARGWYVIDVSRRSIEETAAEILTILAKRNRLPVHVQSVW